MPGLPRIHWRETRDYRDPEFEPRDIIAEGEPGSWRFSVQYLFEIRAATEHPTPALCAEADRRWTELVATIRRGSRV